jgi:acetylornithine deacetylase/succinyl-diaminopimelate desuccinylase-like protein
LKDKYGRITIPHFYDDVLKLSDEEKANFEKLPFDLEAYKKDLDIGELNGEVGFSTLEKIWTRPTLDCNGIWGGYTGEGTKTVIPSKAWAKFSCRLVPNQNAEKIINLVLDYVTKLAPPTVKVRIKSLSGANPVRIDPNNIAVRSAITALKNAFGKDVVFMREGGSIPVVEKFTSVLQAPVVLMGFGLPDDNIHSPNESYSVDNYYGGIRASAEFFNEFSKV